MTDRHDPFGDIEELFDRMTREFDELGGQVDVGRGGIDVDVVEDDEAVTVTADVPGFDREEIDITVEDNVLTIAAEQIEEEETDEGERYHRRERRRSASRRIPLPADIEETEATATYEGGVLTVTLPKVDPEDGGGKSIDIE